MIEKTPEWKALQRARFVVECFEADLARGPYVGDLDQTDDDDRVVIYTRRCDHRDRVSAWIARASLAVDVRLRAWLDSLPPVVPAVRP